MVLENQGTLFKEVEKPEALKEFDHWLMFADFESHSCFQQSPLSDNGTMHPHRRDSKTAQNGIMKRSWTIFKGMPIRNTRERQIPPAR